MSSRSKRFILSAGPVVATLMWATLSLSGQTGAKNGQWRTYGADLGNTRYSPLDQINAGNFTNLEVAWRFKTDNLGPRPEFNLEATPLMANGMLYSVAGTRRAVVALNPGSGELKWAYSIDEGARGLAAPRQLSGRGLAYWSSGADERILYVTPGYQLIALDAKTGRPIPSFGKNGIVDLKLEDDQVMDLVTGEIGYHTAPVVSGNTIIIGAAHLSGSAPRSMRNEKGFVRGYDVRTGKRMWIFHTIPTPGEFGNDTWEKDSWAYTGNTGSWAQMAIDEELGLAYLPIESPTGDYYGGHRPGNGLFGETLVAVDLKTGKRKWHFQITHHGIWDYDISCGPILMDITVDGRSIKAIAQPGKQGWLFVFDRVTGVPVWPIEERPVPQTDVPGEKTSPTQPFPTKPPPYGVTDVTVDQLIDFTPELRAEALKLVSRYKMGPMYTPPVVSKVEGPLGTITAGMATKWEGGSYDPETHMVYMSPSMSFSSLGLVPPANKERSDMNYISGVATASTGRGGGGRGRGGASDIVPELQPATARDMGGEGGLSVKGLPLAKAPYQTIVAVDMNKGEIAWRVPHGETPDAIRNNPALKGVTIPKTGRLGRIAPLVTKTLVIAGEGSSVTLPDGRRGTMLDAYDKATGKLVGTVPLSSQESGSPMTYMYNGRQYIVMAIGGGSYTSEFVALALPK